RAEDLAGLHPVRPGRTTRRPRGGGVGHVGERGRAGQVSRAKAVARGGPRSHGLSVLFAKCWPANSTISYNGAQWSPPIGATRAAPCEAPLPMDARAISHPPADALHAFGLGKLDEASAASIIAHLEHCPHCRHEAVAVTSD